LAKRVAKAFAGFRFTRHVDDFAVHVVKPAVIDAPQAAVVEPAEAQIRAAVRAVGIDEADPPAIVAKQHQLFAE
jgi:hypothetical protein